MSQMIGEQMRYIGGKTKLLADIRQLVNDTVTDDSTTFLDLFSGTGVVANAFKDRFVVHANDKLYFSYLLLVGAVELNNTPSFDSLSDIGITDPLVYLNKLSPDINDSYFIYHNYSPAGACKRMYFTPENAAKIDAIRQKTEQWYEQKLIKQNEYDYLLSVLIEAVPYISNITGTYGAYLKHWDNRAKKPLVLEHSILINNGRANKAYNMDAAALARVLPVDVCYIDPPYNSRQYTSNYHLLETIARYDSPIIKGVTGMRQFNRDDASLFCRKRHAYAAFDEVIKAVKAQHIIISYSSDGILSKQEIKNILQTHGDRASIRFTPIVYETYRSKIAGSPTVNEYLFYVRKSCH